MIRKDFDDRRLSLILTFGIVLTLLLSGSLDIRLLHASGDTLVSSVTASTAICEPTIATTYQASYAEVPLYAGICNPAAAIFDSKGDLWVADRLGRVLEFIPPFVN